MYIYPIIYYILCCVGLRMDSDHTISGYTPFCVEIIEHLFMANRASCDDVYLTKNNIKVLFCIDEEYHDILHDGLPFVGLLRIKRHFTIIDDDPSVDIVKIFDPFFDEIETAIKKEQNVMIHCFAGISRGVTVILAYLMKKLHYSLSDAMKLIKDKRQNIQPNQGFMKLLEKIDESL